MLKSNQIILAVHIGHDASASVLQDGKIVGHALRERHSKVRHHLGIDRQTIEMSLEKSKLTLENIDVIAVTATQQIPNIINDSDWFSFQEQPGNLDLNSYRLIENPFWKNAESFIVERCGKDKASSLIAEFGKTRGATLKPQSESEVLGIISPLFGPKDWLKPHGIKNQFDKVQLSIKSSKGKFFGFLPPPPPSILLSNYGSVGGEIDSGVFHQSPHGACCF